MERKNQGFLLSESLNPRSPKPLSLSPGMSLSAAPL